MALGRSIFILLFIYLSAPSGLNGQINSNDVFFDKCDQLFSQYVIDGQVDYKKLQREPLLQELIQFVKGEQNGIDDINTKKAFRINAYNLLVIDKIVSKYPISSVQDVAGFFDRSKIIVEGVETTLGEYEKKQILSIFNDARLHFVLVCGAKGCPQIINKAYRPKTLEKQLELQTIKTLNDPQFIKNNAKTIELSQIFNWYASDFGGQKNLLAFINKYRSKTLSSDQMIEFYDYNWWLNDSEYVFTNADNSDNRYVVSAAIPKGEYEFKTFNNLYTQTIGDKNNGGSRSTFYTNAFSALYGFSNRFNIGFAGRYRFVQNSNLPSSPLNVFTFEKSPNNRNGLTALGPMIRFAPSKSLSNFTIQSTLTFPVGKELAGNGNDKTYIDWNGGVFNTQFFYDQTISSKFSLFTEIDLLFEDFGFPIEQFSYRFSTPVVAILSYFPTPKSTAYLITGFSPYWQKEFDYFVQGGVGVKYQLMSNFEIELLYTIFRNKYLLKNDGRASTYNFGIRYSL